MYFLIDACNNPTVLRVLYFISLILDIVFIAIPIGLIIMLMVDFSKAVISNNSDEQLKSTKLVVKRIIYAIIVFVIPWIVSVTMNIIESTGVKIGGDYKQCLLNIDDINQGIKTFDYFDALVEIEEENDVEIPSSGGELESGSIYEKVADDLINLIENEVGNSDSKKYGASGGSAWCGYFTTWALKNTKMSDGSSLYNYINKDGYIQSDGEASGVWPAFVKSSHLKFHSSMAYGGSYVPKKGDIVWFRWSDGYCKNNGFADLNVNNRCADHVGIVVGYDGNNVLTIEGNSNNQVFAHNNRKMSDIVAFGSWYD